MAHAQGATETLRDRWRPGSEKALIRGSKQSFLSFRSRAEKRRRTADTDEVVILESSSQPTDTTRVIDTG